MAVVVIWSIVTTLLCILLTKISPTSLGATTSAKLNLPPAYVDPMLIKEGIGNLTLSGGFGVTQRKDNSYQWTFKDKPLYRWFKDQQPGDTSGDGVKQVWHLIIQ